MRRVWSTAVISVLAFAAVTPVPVRASATPASIAAAAYARLSPAQRIGQLFMVGVSASGASAHTRDLLSKYDVGNVILTGPSHAGISAVATRVAPTRATTAHSGVLPFVAVDQEGG